MIIDSELVYNMQSHKYLITEEGFSERFGMNISTFVNMPGTSNRDLAVKSFIRRVSEDVYTYIYNFSYDMFVKEWYLANDEKMVEGLKTALYEYGYYLILSGTSELVLSAMETQKVAKDRKKMLMDMLPMNVQMILHSYDITFKGRYANFNTELLKDKGVSY